MSESFQNDPGKREDGNIETVPIPALEGILNQAEKDSIIFRFDATLGGYFDWNAYYNINIFKN